MSIGRSLMVWTRWPLHADALVVSLAQAGVPATAVRTPDETKGVLLASVDAPNLAQVLGCRAGAGEATVVWGGSLPAAKVLALREAGASAWVSALALPRELAAVIERVREGQDVEWPPQDAASVSLTSREHEVAVAYLVTQADRARVEVAQSLGISDRTLIAVLDGTFLHPCLIRRNRHVTQNITTHPSRRTIAKGAAWAVPAVAVAATAPALAASPTNECAPGSLVVAVQNCSGVDLLQALPYFTITNPNNCTVPAGTAVTLSGAGLAEINLADVVALNADVLFNESGEGVLDQDLGPNDTIQVYVFPEGLNVGVFGEYTLTVLGTSGTFDLNAGVGGVATVCDVINLP